MQYPTGASRFVFILAHPAGHVGAPRFYSPYFASQDLDWHMVPLDVAPGDLADTIRTLACSNSVVGFNLTMPHKAAAFALCDAVGPNATFEGVVNTIRIEAGGHLIGDSFDGAGFLDAARAEGVFDPGRRCVVVGAGGAGRSICHALAAAGVKRFSLRDVTPRAAQTLANRLQAHFEGLDFAGDGSFADAGLFVNATPLGLHADDPLPVDPALLPADCAVFDIIAARQTELMVTAAARGLKTVGGGAMINHQLPLQTAFWRSETLAPASSRESTS